MSKTDTVSPLRQRMIEDIAARKLNPHTQRSHISSCKRFAAWLKRSPDTATADDVRRFQLHLIESGASICNRNRIMTGVRFLFRVTLRRHDLAAEIWQLPPVLSPEEVKRVLTMATSLKARAMLTLTYGCGLWASEVVRLRACDIDSEQMIIRVVQSKGRKDRHVMLPAEILASSRVWRRCRRHHHEPRTGDEPSGAEEFADHLVGGSLLRAARRPESARPALEPNLFFFACSRLSAAVHPIKPNSTESEADPV